MRLRRESGCRLPDLFGLPGGEGGSTWLAWDAGRCCISTSETTPTISKSPELFTPADSEVDADRIFAFGKKFLDEGLIDDCDRKRSGCVMLGDSAPAKNMLADDLEELRADTNPRRADGVVRRRAPDGLG